MLFVHIGFLQVNLQVTWKDHFTLFLSSFNDHFTSLSHILFSLSHSLSSPSLSSHSLPAPPFIGFLSSLIAASPSPLVARCCLALALALHPFLTACLCLPLPRLQAPLPRYPNHPDYPNRSAMRGEKKWNTRQELPWHAWTRIKTTEAKLYTCMHYMNTVNTAVTR